VNWTSNLFSSAPESPAAPWDENVLLVDVRSAGEFSSGHVDGAVNVPLDRFAQSCAAVLPDKSRQVVLYCQSGARSGQAAQFMQQQGYEKVINGGSAGAVAMKTNRGILRS
jgi:phage shock protein E